MPYRLYVNVKCVNVLCSLIVRSLFVVPPTPLLTAGIQHPPRHWTGWDHREWAVTKWGGVASDWSMVRESSTTTYTGRDDTESSDIHVIGKLVNTARNTQEKECQSFIQLFIHS